MMRLEVFRLATEMLQYLDPAGLDETVLNIGQIKTSLDEEMQNLPYARPDGIYPDMTVGAVIGADSTAQWATRESTGTGSATVRSVQGAAVGWNQMLNYPNGAQSGWAQNNSTVSFNDGVVSVTPSRQYGGVFYRYVSLIEGHKYLMTLDYNIPTAAILGTYSAYTETGVYFANLFNAAGASGWVHNGAFIVATSTVSSTRIFFQDNRTSDWDTWSIKNVMLFDLTQMFGSGNEPATVEEFEAMFPEAYYPYSAPVLKPVQISGIRSTYAQGGELDSVEWPTQTLRAAGSVADVLYSDHVDMKVGVYTFTGSETLQIDNWQPTEDTYAVGFPLAMIDASWPTSTDIISNVRMAELETIAYSFMYNGTKTGLCLAPKPQASAYSLFVRVPKTLASDKNALMAWLAGKTIFYALATPTTTPISPALPMTYKVQQGGSESIIVPDGEVSAAPVLTVAEPVNAGDEFARIWEAIQSLGYTRNATQLSRPVSLTDIGSIDEVQKDTADVVEIDTTKEVTE